VAINEEKGTQLRIEDYGLFPQGFRHLTLIVATSAISAAEEAAGSG
jgi:hypothetical protein